ncbi:DUF11 domain-containing protein [Achromobacter sp. AONIH1]|uniref:DUF7933 domain-containing protein n=1 Tax=Achromobacter sp. AONIH1 TaxID=1758194 RepID=UPI001319C1AC|nr:DUF11 domain-containing protein [Achromobacter sp. AONIH1]
MTMQATKNRRPRKAHWLPALMIAGALLMPGMEQAHAQSRTIVNTGFDKLMNGASPNPPSNAPLYLDDARCTLGVAGKCLAGWQSTHPAHYEFGHMIEAGSSTAIYGVTPNSGTAFVELNAATRSRLYQNICLKSGESIRLSYFLSSRSGTNGAFASQVQAGIWPLNHAGPIGGAIMAVPSSVRPAEQPGWNEETAVLTLPAGYPSGIYQLGFEAILPGNNSSYSNLLDNVTIPIKPLIDLGGSQMNAVAIEGAEAPAIKVRINGRVNTPITLVFKASGTAKPDEDYRLGQPAGLPGSTPTLEHKDGSDTWTLLVPQGEYHGGLSTTVGGGVISLPFEALADDAAEDNETAVFTLQAPGVNGASPSLDWNMEDPVCSGTGDTVKQASYLIKEAVPTIKFSGTVYNDQNGNDALDEQENWTSVEPLASNVYVNLVRKNEVVSSQAVVPGAGSYQFAAPSDTDYTIVLSDSPANPSPTPPVYWRFKSPASGILGPYSEGQDTQDFGLTPATDASLSKAFDQIRIPLQGKAKVIFKLKNSNNGLDQHDGLAFTDLLPEGLLIDGQPQAAQCGGTVTVSTQDGRSRLRFAGGSLPKGVSSCDVTATVLGQTLGLKTNDQSNLSEVSSNLAVSVNASIRVGLNYDVEGAVYRDANANGHLDAEEGGVGATLWVKLTPRAGGQCQAPALDVVVADAASGRYHIKAAPAGDYCLIPSDNRDPADITPSTPGWTPSAPADGRLSISISNADLRNRDLGLYRGLIVKGRVFRDTGTPDARAGNTANNGVADSAEPGLPGVGVRVQAGGRVYSSGSTDADGAYALFVPVPQDGGPAAGQPIEVAQTNPQGHVSTGASVQGKPISGSASVGGTQYTYDRDADILSFAPGGRSVLDGLDFGDVPDSRLSHDGNLDGTPGAALTFPHVFTAGTRGSLRLSSSAVPSPPAENWTDALYRDINCNGQIDVDTDTLIPSEQVFDLNTGQNLCLVHKQFIPANAATGHRNVVTLRAELTYANAAPALSAVYTREDRTTVAQSGALELVKEVRHTGPNCTPLPSPQGDWTSNNQARPGDWLQYRITYRNKNIDPLRNLVITDATPAFTRYVNATCGTSTPDGLACSPPSAGSNPPSAPKAGAAGILRWEFQDKPGATGGLLSGAAGNVDFCIQLEP